MEWLKTASKLSNANENEKKFFLHETKYALLGVTLFIIFTIPWTGSIIRNTFPGGRGPMLLVYKVGLYIALYYIIQKTDWFQEM